MDYRAFTLAVSLLGLLLPPAAFPQEAVARLKDDGFREQLVQEASVSGRVVTGVLLADSPAAHSLALFSAPLEAGADVCVRVVSRDGLYWSENTFRWPAAAGVDVVRLQYPSRYDLSHYGGTELSVLAYEGDCSEARSGPVLVALRGDSGPEPEALDIFVNSGRADTFAVLTPPGGATTTIACHLIREGRRTGYDTICTVPLAGSRDATLAVRIVRRRFDRMMPPTELVVRMPQQDR